MAAESKQGMIRQGTMNEEGFISAASLLKNVEHLMEIEFHDHTIVKAVNEDPQVKVALEELDIEADDHKRLGDILDPDHSGTIGVPELINGLQRLRGVPRRSDVVTVDLQVRSLQERLEEVNQTLESLVEAVEGIGKDTKQTRHTTQRLGAEIIKEEKKMLDLADMDHL